jgi:gas vesicle protein
MSKGTFLFGAAIGGAAAYAAAFLFAPKSGEEYQRELKDKAEMMKESSSDYLSIAKERGGDFKAIATDAAIGLKTDIQLVSKQLAEQIKMDSQILKSDLKDVKDGVPGSKENLKANLMDAATEVKYTAASLKEQVSQTTSEAKDISLAVIDEAKMEIDETKAENSSVNNF